MVARLTVEDKVGQWEVAFRAIAASLTNQDIVDRFNELMSIPLPDDPDNVITYTARMNTALALGRMLAANDRAAAYTAALVTQTGIKPISLDAGDDT